MACEWGRYISSSRTRKVQPWYDRVSHMTAISFAKLYLWADHPHRRIRLSSAGGMMKFMSASCGRGHCFLWFDKSQMTFLICSSTKYFILFWKCENQFTCLHTNTATLECYQHIETHWTITHCRCMYCMRNHHWNSDTEFIWRLCGESKTTLP